MKTHMSYLVGILATVFIATAARAEIYVVSERNDSADAATRAFKFKNVPAPLRTDAATNAKFAIVDGRRDRNGGNVDALHDGRLPNDEDQPSDNFFFDVRADGGQLLIDLGAVVEVRRVSSYSWHPNSRGPQVYKLYAADGVADGFNAQPGKGTDPTTRGWKFIAAVDTRPEQGGGGQYGVNVSDGDGPLGKYRYLLLDISRTESSNPFGNTFYSEIDVDDGQVHESTPPTAPESRVEIVKVADGKCEITVDTTEAPDLTQWAHDQLAPVLREWYPKIVDMLPSEGYEAPPQASITFSERMQGVAATGGTRIRCSARWVRQNLEGEAKGAIVHELVHVVQQYSLARRAGRGAERTPGWVVEGIADYIRWFHYEPQTGGAEITGRAVDRARYDGSYRVTGNFINWVANTYDKQIVAKLNAAAREGRYVDEIWQKATGHTVAELGDQWKTALAHGSDPIPASPEPAATETVATQDTNINILTDEEKAAGWKLLFDGKTFDGWHNFKQDGVRKGWQVKDGALVCADPHNAGDLCTDDAYDWFELKLEYNISAGGNSGIMYHVTDKGNATWATGPEMQLEDNAAAADPVRCGWLYALYQPPNDSKTGKPLDATKPAGQWNQLRLLISREKCEHEVNGQKYLEYVLGSEDFKQRVAKSKFGRMPLFAKSDTGYIALQGDHGQVSFRNIKIRPIKTEK